MSEAVTGPTREEILREGVERIDGPPPAVPLPTTQRRGDPGAGLSGPKTSQEYNVYFGEEVWRVRVGGEDAAPELRKRFLELGEAWSSAFREYLAAKDDVRLSDFAKRERVHVKATAPIKVALDRAEKELAAAERRVSELRAEAAEKLRQRAPEAALAGEIRAYVRGLPEGERVGFLNRAAETGDLGTLAAVLGAPGYLSGIQEGRFSAVHERVLNQLAPAEAQRVERLVKATELVRQRVGNLRAWMSETSLGVNSQSNRGFQDGSSNGVTIGVTQQETPPGSPAGLPSSSGGAAEGVDGICCVGRQ